MNDTGLQTLGGVDIPLTTRGILYLCVFYRASEKLEVVNEILRDSAFEALELYANIPNPESQLVTGKTYDELIQNLHKLHSDMKNPQWLKSLAECI